MLSPVRGGIQIICSLALTSALLADDIAPLSDEFDDAGTFGNWQDLGLVEGWGTPSYEAADVDTTESGRFHIVPGANTWFAHLRGLLFFKEIEGDFIATLRVRVLSRHNPADPTEVPNRSFSLTGILVHGPRTITQAAPDPYTTAAVWPPADFGSDYVPNTENYIFLAYGTAGNAGTRQFEIKATRNSSSRLYFDDTGIDQSNTEAWLQMVRVGDTVVCLRKHALNGPWLVENRYPNPDHPFPDFGTTLQVGITAYTDWPTASPFNSAGLQASYHFNYAPPSTGNPDLISQVDYFRLQRPDPALSEAALQAMSVSYNPASNSTADPPVELAASPAAAPYLGENSNAIYDPFGNWQIQEFGANAGSAAAQPAADPDGDGATNAEEFVFATDPEASSSAPEIGVSPNATDVELTFTPAIENGALIEVQHSTNLVTWETVASRPLIGGDWQTDGASVTIDTGSGEVNASLPAPDPRLFVRLSISL